MIPSQIDLPQDMIDKYLYRRRLDFARLEVSFAAGEVKEFNSVGHQIAGNAENFGFLELAELGVQMEKLQLSNLMEDGPALLAALKAWLESKS